MSELNFDPNERVVAHSVESHGQSPAKTPVSRGTAPVVRQQAPTARQTPPPSTEVSTQSRPVGQPQQSRSQQLYGGAAFNETSNVGNRTAPQNQQAAKARVQQPAPPAAAVDDFETTQGQNITLPVSQTRLPLVVTTERVVTAAHEDVFLPSGFVPYIWKDIQVRRFNIEEVRAVVRARTSGNLRHLIRAVDTTLSRPVTELTIGDFWYLMYWHRLNSYKKSPFVIEWLCRDHDHVQWVKDGQRPLRDGETAQIGEDGVEQTTVPIEAKSLRNLLTVNRSNLTTQEINNARYAELRTQLLTEYGVHIRPQSLVDFISAQDEDEALESQRKDNVKQRQDAANVAAESGDVDAVLHVNRELEQVEQDNMVEDEARSFSYRYAALLGSEHGETLAERVSWLDKQSPDLLVDLEEALEVTDHGVTESWTVKCMECGASATVNQSLDALTFLPSLQRGGLT